MDQNDQSDRNDQSRQPEQSDPAPRQDPWWPEVEGGHPVTELLAPTQGAPSPFGETQFPLPADQLDYQHPVTEINH